MINEMISKESGEFFQVVPKSDFFSSLLKRRDKSDFLSFRRKVKNEEMGYENYKVKKCDLYFFVAFQFHCVTDLLILVSGFF